MIVLDACTVISWVLDDEDSATAASALEYAVRHGALVPGNFASEIVHALTRAERRKRIDEVTAALALTEILHLPLSVEMADPHAMLTLSKAHCLTGYDAAYLALALQVHKPLATIDALLATAAKKVGCAWDPEH